MNKIKNILTLNLHATSNLFAHNHATRPIKVKTEVKVKNHISTSILLWVRKDKPREVSMNYWKGPHAKEIGPTLANGGILKELRSQTFMPWKQKQWDSPNVAHDNAPEVQFHASLILGFSSENDMQFFFKDEKLKQLSNRLSVYCTAIHAYNVSDAITFVKDGKIIL